MKKLEGNFTMIPNNYINDPRLDVYEFRVLCYLMSLTDDNFCCYPSYGTIAQMTGVSGTKVINAIKKLESCGIITKECRDRKDSSHATNYYTVFSQDMQNGTCDAEGGTCDAEGGTCDAEGGACDAEGSACDAHNQYLYNKNHNTNTHFTNTINGGEKSSGFDELMNKFDQYEIEGEMKKNYKTALEIMYNSPSITVGSETVVREKVQARLGNLSYEHIVAVDRNKPMRLEGKRLVSDVRNPVAYIVTALYNTLRYTEEELVKMEYGDDMW